MKITGYCTSCRRVRVVRVSPSEMAKHARSGMFSGVCDDCTENDELRRLSDRQLLHRLNTVGGRGSNPIRDEARRRNLI